MVPSIGHDYLYKGRVVHVQDRDNIDMTAQVGEPDDNDIVWAPCWVPWSELSPLREAE